MGCPKRFALLLVQGILTIWAANILAKPLHSPIALGWPVIEKWCSAELTNFASLVNGINNTVGFINALTD